MRSGGWVSHTGGGAVRADRVGRASGNPGTDGSNAVRSGSWADAIITSACRSKGKREHFCEIGGRNSRGVVAGAGEGAAADISDCGPEECDDFDSAESNSWRAIRGLLEDEHAERGYGRVSLLRL